MLTVERLNFREPLLAFVGSFTSISIYSKLLQKDLSTESLFNSCLT